MTMGVGGVAKSAALAALSDMTVGAEPITRSEYLARISRAQEKMREQRIAAIFVNAGSNLRYFTGTLWRPSERLVGAIIPAHGALEYIAPAFEVGTLRDFMVVDGKVNAWEEHENPYQLLLNTVQRMGMRPDPFAKPCIGICESAAFFVYDGIRNFARGYELINGGAITAQCRMRKSPHEIALMQRAHIMTLAVQRSAASVLHEGITTTEVERFIDEAHQAVGAAGSFFCIVLFGQATAFPHGVRHPQTLKRGDMVLIDTGCLVHGYMSDLTRTYVFGSANARQRSVWNSEKGAQVAAFRAAQLGVPCAHVDLAARRSLEADGFGPGYELPGLPHRTGHGIGLDIHESPYLVGNDHTPLDIGMCFSNEPMICVPGEFGVRLEDHIYMTADGPAWFTQPSHSVDDPFALESR